MIDLATLQSAAEAATPRPWRRPDLAERIANYQAYGVRLEVSLETLTSERDRLRDVVDKVRAVALAGSGFNQPIHSNEILTALKGSGE